MALLSDFLDILQRPTIGDMMIELMVFMAPIWIAVLVGIMVGWAWKPKWANLNVDFLEYNAKKEETSNSSFSSSGSKMVFSQLASMPNLHSLKLQVPSCILWTSSFGPEKESSSLPPISSPESSSSKVGEETEKSSFVTEDDLKHLHQLVEEKDGGPPWIQMMDRSAPNMSYQAWRRDPESGPPQYRSRSVYEDACPELVRDFFWDDEFRMKWDDMLLHAETVEECPTTGTMVVRWVRKFPFFCSDREYIIGRRIWNCERTYYCITKGVPFPSLPRHNKPRRVDLYYSSWCIRAAESKRDGKLTACEVLFFHHEDMGIPWEIAKLGVRQGMWGAVKKIDPGLCAYQKHRSSGAPLSHCTSMAQINAKVSVASLESLESTSCSSEVESVDSKGDSTGKGFPKFLVIGGAIVLACTLDRGLLTKAVIFGVARRFANMGRRL